MQRSLHTLSLRKPATSLLPVLPASYGWLGSCCGPYLCSHPLPSWATIHQLNCPLRSAHSDGSCPPSHPALPHAGTGRGGDRHDARHTRPCGLGRCELLLALFIVLDGDKGRICIPSFHASTSSQTRSAMSASKVLFNRPTDLSPRPQPALQSSCWRQPPPPPSTRPTY